MTNNFEKVATSGGKKTDGIIVGIPNQDFRKEQRSKEIFKKNEEIFGLENRLKDDYIKINEKIIDFHEKLGSRIKKSKEEQKIIDDLNKEKKENVQAQEIIRKQGGIGSIKGDS